MRCDSAAIVPNTSELLPEPDTPVNTVSRRFGISMLTSLRLFTRAPCTRIRSWLSAVCGAGDPGSVLVAMLIVSPSVRAGPSLHSGPAVRAGSSVGRPSVGRGRRSPVLKQPEHVPVEVGDGRHQAPAPHIVRGLLHGGP